ncbi:thioredoxin family protein [Bacteroides sp. 224]|uniref:thioredoxin family protein n=1 Tax=Bacteroides sp. 224 TaxID=2302936 RepID=UPI0013D6EDF4|nr:thioredoxin family protein [Bacteroides sp. 224]NDV66905.1 hypothetical protein [Bacteroides sp. 224]
MLDKEVIDYLQTTFEDLKSHYVFDVTISSEHPHRGELLNILDDLVKCSPNLSYQLKEGDGLEFTLLKDGVDTRIKFRSSPNGHEFKTLILAIVNSEGRGQNLPEERIIQEIQKITKPIHIVTYISLNCAICGELTQMINAMVLVNEHLSHEIVDGGINKLEIIDNNIKVVPSVFVNGSLVHVGKGSYEELIEKLG